MLGVDCRLYIGVVESRDDPEHMGRVKVRIFGIHSDSRALLPTDDLPYAIPLQSINSSGISGIGTTPIGILPGSWVIVTFLDPDLQQPLVLGTISSKISELQTFNQIGRRDILSNSQTDILKDSNGNPVLDSSGNPIRYGRKSVDGWYLGKTSSRYESGNAGAGSINNYNGAAAMDYGGASYGAYQFASYLPEIMPNGKRRPNWKTSPLMSYLAVSKFKERFDGLTPATFAFDTAWKKLANETKAASQGTKNPDLFWLDQHEYVKRKYYDVAIANLQRYNLDLSKFGSGVQDLVWSTAVQLGPANTKVYTIPLSGKSALTDTDIIELVSQYKIENVHNLFKSSSNDIVESVKNRWKDEKLALLSLTNESIA